MKNLLTIILFSNFFIWNGLAQKFPTDASGEIVYQEIVEVDSLKKEVAYQNGLKWMETLKHEQLVVTRKDSIEGNLSGHSSFFVYDQSGVFKKISGKISYSLSIDVKDGKYRYSFSDFVFHYYKQDRYYNMVETGKTKNIKEAEAKGWQKLWDKHRTSTNDEVNKNIRSLNIIMKERPGINLEKAQTKKTEW